MAPNILLITADDMDALTPGAFGGPADVTPNLDALAASGRIFRRSHVPIAVCQPSRSAIMTGLWPHRNGAEGFEPIHDGVPLLTQLLAAHGYVTGILGKVEHIQPVERFGWDLKRGMVELGMGRDPEAYGRAAAEFFALAGDREAPWFLMANAHDPHRPFHGSLAEMEKWTVEERETYPDPSAEYGPDHVPPRFLPGGMVRAPFQLTDVLPSVLEAAGVSADSGGGVSFLPAARGEVPVPHPLYWEHIGNAAIRDGDWKAVREAGRPWELYDLAADRSELHDLASQHPEIVDRLAADWQRWADRVGVISWDLIKEQGA